MWGDDVNTDIIIPFRFKARTNDPVEMAKYCMYGFDPEFYKKVKKGDIFVAGKNFGQLIRHRLASTRGSRHNQRD